MEETRRGGQDKNRDDRGGDIRALLNLPPLPRIAQFFICRLLCLFATGFAHGNKPCTNPSIDSWVNISRSITQTRVVV
jgi:hypothetical protein